jgi:hypothetical protein
MEITWSYKIYQVHEGMKPKAPHFQYFYTVLDGKDKICNYCIWIEDDALSRFDSSCDFESIANSHRGEWSVWVKDNLDRKIFRNMAMKYSKDGKEEIDLDKAKGKISID